MKVGDLVQVTGPHWHLDGKDAGMLGIVVNDLAGKGRAFKVLLSNGKIRPKLFSQLEMISESR